jgi:hypothetical protein
MPFLIGGHPKNHPNFVGALHLHKFARDIETLGFDSLLSGSELSVKIEKA